MRDERSQTSSDAGDGRPLNLDSVLALEADVRFRAVGEETVVLRQRAAEMLVLNEVAGELVALCDGERDLAACARTLGERYAVADRDLERDVLAFATTLVREGLAHLVPPSRR
jgi:hypothetical protein